MSNGCVLGAPSQVRPVLRHDNPLWAHRCAWPITAPRLTWLWVGVALLVTTVSWAGTNVPLNHASSVSRQFTAYAPSSTLPPALCIFAEHIKHEWLDRLAAVDNWRDPIVLVFRADPASNATATAIALGIYQVGSVLKYEISGRLPPAPDEPALAAAIIKALCLETANRHRPSGPAPWTSAQIPLWLVRGLSGSIQGDPDWLRAVARRSAAAARPPTVSEILGATELPGDEVARNLFLANAWLLTDSLLRLPDGGAKLHRFIEELRGADVSFSNAYRSDFSDIRALEKWWSLVQAHLTTVVIPQNLTTHATAQQLDALLSLADGQPFNDLYRHSDQPALRQAVAQRVNELEGLRTRAHPLYRPALAAYIEAGRWLVDGHISRYRRSVAHADQLRREARRQAEAISVTLDVAEQKYSPAAGRSVWDDYFQTMEKLERFKRQHRDPISDYLDQFDH